jgi:biopolymer transport protein ExbD
MRVKKPEDEPFELMLIPMIDCMLVIIIFFLVATTLKHEKELPLHLPESSAALRTKQSPDLFVIGMDKEGRAYLTTGNGPMQVDTEELHRRIRELAQSDPERRVRIDGDRDARFQDIVHILDLCEFEGLKNIGLHTRSDDGH